MSQVIPLSISRETRKKVLEQNYRKARQEFDDYKSSYVATDPRSHKRYMELFDAVQNTLAIMNRFDQ